MDNDPNNSTGLDFDNDDFRLVDLLSTLIEGRWLVFGTMVAALSIGFAYNFVATPIYKADGLLQVEERTSDLGTFDVASMFEGDTSVSAEIEILRSRLVLGAVVDNLKLDITASPDYMPVIGVALARRADESERNAIQLETLDVPDSLIERSMLLIAGPDDDYRLMSPAGDLLLNGIVGKSASGIYDGDTVTIIVSNLRAEENDTFHVMRLSRLKSIAHLKSSLSIREQGRSSGILAVSLEGGDPEQVSQRVNEIADAYVRQNKDRKAKEAENTLDFLDEQLPTVKQDMEQAEVILNTYRLDKGSIDLSQETQAILETIVSAEGQLSELKQDRDKVTQGFTVVHPMVVALDKQIDRLNKEISGLNDQVRELPNTQQEVLRLVRDVAVNTELYTSLLNAAQELRVVKAGTIGNVRIVDTAIAPRNPIRPRKFLVLLTSLIFGVMIGVVVTFARRALRGGVDDPELIEKKINIPVYAAIAHSKRQDQINKNLQPKSEEQALLAVDNPNDVTIESLRNLRTALHFGMMGGKNNCVMITGPSPSIGKSFVSANLAAVLTNNGKNVLLIDGDLRRGHLHSYLGLDKANGLSDFISDQITIDQALHQTSVDGLTFLPAGKTPPNPSELLLHKRFGECLDDMAAKFDHVIIDTPPVLAVTDAAIIGQLVGTTMMVLKSGAHTMREIELSIKRLQQNGVKVNGVLINDTSLHKRRYGAEEYNYQYSYASTQVKS